MGATTRDELERILHRLAAGDAAYTVTFTERYGSGVTRAASAARAGEGTTDLETVVLDVAFALLGRARQPGIEGWDLVLVVLSEVMGRGGRGPEPPSGPGAPARRTLHLVDIENLAGGPARVDRWFGSALRQYQAVAEPRPVDHVVMAADRTVYARTAWDVDPGWTYRFGIGPDGADRALLDAADPGWVHGRFDRVVVGSGDHAFAPLVVDLLGRGVPVTVVSRPRNLSGRLRRSGAHVVTLPDLPDAATLTWAA